MDSTIPSFTDLFIAYVANSWEHRRFGERFNRICVSGGRAIGVWVNAPAFLIVAMLCKGIACEPSTAFWLVGVFGMAVTAPCAFAANGICVDFLRRSYGQHWHGRSWFSVLLSGQWDWSRLDGEDSNDPRRRFSRIAERRRPSAGLWPMAGVEDFDR